VSTPSAPRPPVGGRRVEINKPLLLLAMVVTVLGNIPLGAVAVTFVIRGQDRRAMKWIVAAVVAGILTAAFVLALRA
jgi:hypothetical protein